MCLGAFACIYVAHFGSISVKIASQFCWMSEHYSDKNVNSGLHVHSC